MRRRLSSLLVLLGCLWATAAGAQFAPGTPTDAFNRANEGPPPSANWTNTVLSQEAAGLRVLNNVAVKGAVADQGGAWWNAGLIGPDAQASVTVTDATPSGTISLYLRLTSPGIAATTAGYDCTVNVDDATPNVYLIRLENSNQVILTSTTAVNINDGDSFGCSIIGTAFTFWHKPAAGSWTQVLSTTDGIVTAAGYSGLRVSNTDLLSMDDFWTATVNQGGSPTFGPVGTALDDFNRANENPLSQGGLWTQKVISTNPSTLTVESNQLDRDALAGDSSAYRNNAFFGPDVEVALTLPDSVGGNSYIGLYLRLVNAGTPGTAGGYACWYNQQNTNIIVRVMNNSSNATIGTFPVTITNGDSIGCQAIGNQICAWTKPAAGSWTQAGCVPDSQHSAAGRVGAFLNTSNYFGDNFWAQTLTVATPGRRRGGLVRME